MLRHGPSVARARYIIGAMHPDIVKWEIDYRRQKQWNIFSWCSTLLVAIIGGTITLRTGVFAKTPVTWDVKLQSLVTFAVVVLVFYTCLWIYHSDYRENEAIKHLDDNAKILLMRDNNRWGWTYSSRVVVVLLGAAAILAIWIPIQLKVQ